MENGALLFGGDRILVDDEANVEVDEDSIRRSMEYAKLIFKEGTINFDDCGFWAKTMPFTKSLKPVSQEFEKNVTLKI